MVMNLQATGKFPDVKLSRPNLAVDVIHEDDEALVRLLKPGDQRLVCLLNRRLRQPFFGRLLDSELGDLGAGFGRRTAGVINCGSELRRCVYQLAESVAISADPASPSRSLFSYRFGGLLNAMIVAGLPMGPLGPSSSAEPS